MAKRREIQNCAFRLQFRTSLMSAHFSQIHRIDLDVLKAVIQVKKKSKLCIFFTHKPKYRGRTTKVFPNLTNSIFFQLFKGPWRILLLPIVQLMKQAQGCCETCSWFYWVSSHLLVLTPVEIPCRWCRASGAESTWDGFSLSMHFRFILSTTVFDTCVKIRFLCGGEMFTKF
jgi:hypothetical protein